MGKTHDLHLSIAWSSLFPPYHGGWSVFNASVTCRWQICTSLLESSATANFSITVLRYSTPRGMLALPACSTIFDWSCERVGNTCEESITMYDLHADLLSQWWDFMFCWYSRPREILTRWLCLTKIHHHLSFVIYF